MKKVENMLNFNDISWELPKFKEDIFFEKRYSYALVIPIINEGERIQRQLQNIKDSKILVDVILADGGSTDGSVDLEYLSVAGVRCLLTKVDQGKLSAQLRMAYAWCIRQGYKGVVTVDGNGKDVMSAVTDFVSKLEDGCDYVQGSRYLPGGISQNTPMIRAFANRVFHAPLLSFAGRCWYTDTTNGFRAYSSIYLLDPRVKPFRDIFVHYELLFYLTIRAGQIGSKIGHVPVTRIYPKGQLPPTKIKGLYGYFSILVQTLRAVLGFYKPKDSS